MKTTKTLLVHLLIVNKFLFLEAPYLSVKIKAVPEEKIKVLYVDDEMNNLVAFKALLREDFEVFTAGCAREGLEILKQTEIHVVITDQRMPGVTGVRFLEQVTDLYPAIPRMLLTGYSDIEAIIDAVNNTHIYKCLRKPWNKEALVNAIREGHELYKKDTVHGKIQ